MTEEGSTKMVNFMTSGTGVLVLGRGYINYIVKMHYFFKNSSSLFLGIEQSKYTVMMTNEGPIGTQKTVSLDFYEV